MTSRTFHSIEWDREEAGVLRGDLQTTPLADLLRQLAEAKATGCVYLLAAGSRSDAEESMVALRSGAICNVTAPGSEESVATRLVASRRLDPAALAEAREAQETELANWMLAELLIHLGLAEERRVHDIVIERALADLSELCDWQAGSWRFRRRQRWGASLPEALAVPEALATVEDRQREWRRLLTVILGADAVVSLAAQPVDEPIEPIDEALEMDADGFALLCAVDGVRSVAQLGAAAGFTLLDSGRTISKLVEAGLVELRLDSSADSAADTVTQDDDSADYDDEPYERRTLDAVAAAFAYDPADQLLASHEISDLTPVGAPWQTPRTSIGDPLTDALARVSAALSDAMNEPSAQVPESAPEPEPVAAQLVEQPAEPEELAEPLAEDVAEAPAELESPEPVVDVQPEPIDEFILKPVVDEPDLDELDAAEADVAECDGRQLHVVETDVVDTDSAAAFAALTEASEGGYEVLTEITDAPEWVDVPTLEPDSFIDFQPADTADTADTAPEAVEIEAPVEAPDEAAPPVRAAATHHDMADASRMLSQLAGEELPPPPKPKAPEPTVAEAAPVDYASRPRREDGLADTAALLRELSSLGIENHAPTTAGPTPNRPTPTPAATGGGQHARKRKGRFGRS